MQNLSGRLFLCVFSPIVVQSRRIAGYQTNIEPITYTYNNKENTTSSYQATAYQTITFTNDGTRYVFKFDVNESSPKADLDVNLSVNDDKTLVIAQLPVDIANNVTFIVDGVKYSVAPNRKQPVP